jgi:hypothetical protein
MHRRWSLRDGVGQQHWAACFARLAGRRGQQAGQAVVQLVAGVHAARGVQARQQRVHAGLLQRPGGAGGNVSCYYFHSCSRTSSKALGPENTHNLLPQAARRLLPGECAAFAAQRQRTPWPCVRCWCRAARAVASSACQAWPRRASRRAGRRLSCRRASTWGTVPVGRGGASRRPVPLHPEGVDRRQAPAPSRASFQGWV